MVDGKLIRARYVCSYGWLLTMLHVVRFLNIVYNLLGTFLTTAQAFGALQAVNYVFQDKVAG